MHDQKEREHEAIVESRMRKGQPTNQMALDGMLAQQLASIEQTKEDAVPSRRRTRQTTDLVIVSGGMPR